MNDKKEMPRTFEPLALGGKYIYRKFIGIRADGSPIEKEPIVVTLESIIQGFYHCFNGERRNEENQITATRSELSGAPETLAELQRVTKAWNEAQNNANTLQDIANEALRNKASLQSRLDKAIELLKSLTDVYQTPIANSTKANSAYAFALRFLSTPSPIEK